MDMHEDARGPLTTYILVDDKKWAETCGGLGGPADKGSILVIYANFRVYKPT